MMGALALDIAGRRIVAMVTYTASGTPVPMRVGIVAVALVGDFNRNGGEQLDNNV
jgi:hypothetical protein